MEQANVRPNRARSMTLPVVNNAVNDLTVPGMNEASSSPDAAATTPRPRLFLRRRFASADQVTTDRPDVQGCDSKESSSSTPRSPRFLRRRLIRATTNPGAVCFEQQHPPLRQLLLHSGTNGRMTSPTVFIPNFSSPMGW
jgi:hypothetical protein